MYRVIGRRVIPAECDTIASDMQGEVISNTLIGLVAANIPDGIVFEYSEGGEVLGYYETNRLRLIPITQAGTELITKPRKNRAVCTGKEMAKFRGETVKMYSRWYAAYVLRGRATK